MRYDPVLRVCHRVPRMRKAEFGRIRWRNASQRFRDRFAQSENGELKHTLVETCNSSWKQQFLLWRNLSQRIKRIRKKSSCCRASFSDSLVFSVRSLFSGKAKDPDKICLDSYTLPATSTRPLSRRSRGTPRGTWPGRRRTCAPAGDQREERSDQR